MVYLKKHLFAILGSFLTFFGIFVGLSGCLDNSTNSDTAEVRFSNPNENAILESTDSIQVVVVYQTEESVVLFEGNRQDPGFPGPWNGTIRKADLTLLIIQFDSDGNELVREEYFYFFKNNTLVVSEKLEITPKSLTLLAGGPPLQLGFKLFPSTLDLPIIWSTSNSAIVAITEQGVISPLSEGTVQIIASAGENIKDTITVTVSADVADKETLRILSELEDVIVDVGGDAQFTILAEGENIGYRWKLNGEEQLDETSDTYLLNSVTLDLNKAEIIVEVFTGDTTASSSAKLYVLDPIEPLAFLDTLPDIELNQGDEVSLKALVNKIEDVNFTWMKDEAVVSNSSSYAIPSAGPSDSGTYIVNVSWNGEMVADTFHIALLSPEILEFSLILSINDSLKGTLSIAPDQRVFNYGETVSLTATPTGSDNRFTGWTGDSSSVENPLTLTMDKNYALTANFSEIGKYSVNISVTPEAASGSVSLTPEASSYLSGADISLEATPAEGWVFSGWAGDDDQLTGTESSLSLTVGSQDINGTAEFERVPISVNFSTNPASGSPGSPQTTETNIYWGDTINIQANTAEGYDFESWELDAASAGSISYVKGTANTDETAFIRVTGGDIELTANYSLRQYTITPSTTGSGSISPSTPTEVDHGGTQSFIISPDPTYEISQILVDGTGINLNNFNGTYSFTNVTGPHSIEAVFQKITHSISVIQVSHGTINIANEPADASNEVDEGSNVTLTFVPSSGYELKDVFINGTANTAASVVGSHTFTNIQSDYSVTASFVIKQYSVIFDVGLNGSRISGGALNQTVDHGSAAAAPNIQASTGWLFDGWDKSFSNVTSNLTVTAEYSRKSYTITIASGGGGGVSPSGVQTVFYGDDLVITASPSPSFNDFENWSVTTGVLTLADSKSASTTISNITSSGTVTANFWVCGTDDLVDTRFGNQLYSTVANTTQCWMNQNLNAGTWVHSSDDPTDPGNGIIEKICWQNSESNCLLYGGFYNWHEAMQNAIAPKSQGICPNGWHIPEKTEFQYLIDSGINYNFSTQGYFDGAGNFSISDGGFWASTFESSITPDYFVNNGEDLGTSFYTVSYNIRCIKN